MLKHNSDSPGGAAYLMATGSTTDIVTDIGMLIAGVHSQLRKSDPASAELFQAAVKKLVNDPAIGLWNVEVQAAFGVAATVRKKEGGND